MVSVFRHRTVTGHSPVQCTRASSRAQMQCSGQPGDFASCRCLRLNSRMDPSTTVRISSSSGSGQSSSLSVTPGEMLGWSISHQVWMQPPLQPSKSSWGIAGSPWVDSGARRRTSAGAGASVDYRTLTTPGTVEPESPDPLPYPCAILTTLYPRAPAIAPSVRSRKRSIRRSWPAVIFDLTFTRTSPPVLMGVDC